MYIAVHGGAGTHSHRNEVEVKRALRLACSEALKSQAGINRDREQEAKPTRHTHLEMVQDAITSLENSSHLNAGYGSNLTIDGTVECDAAIMDGYSSDFGSVGAVSGIKNPIQLAGAILQHSKLPDPLGRIPPLTLVSGGAHKFAFDHCASVQMVPAETLVSPRAKDEWTKWKARLNGFQQEDNGEKLGNIQDTVGAVAACQDGIATGVSSGGILLKYPGRIGEAAMFGAGCWAQYFPKAKMGMACSVSGAGEYITRFMLARAVGDAFHLCIMKGSDVDPHDIIHHVFLDTFWGPCRDRGVLEPEAGMLLLTTEETEGTTTARLWCAFTTPSMAIAYASTLHPKPKAQIFRQPTRGVGSCRSSEPHIFVTAVCL